MVSVKMTYESIAHSWSTLRSQPLTFVKPFLEGKSGLLLVEGCGAGRHARLAKELGFKVIGFDFSFNMIKEAVEDDPNSFYLVADARALPFKPGVFDHSLSVAVLHHLKPIDCVKALKELKKVVNGESLISVWRHEQERFKDGPKEVLVSWGKHERYYYLYDQPEFERLVKRTFKLIAERNDEMNIVLIVS